MEKQELKSPAWTELRRMFLSSVLWGSLLLLLPAYVSAQNTLKLKVRTVGFEELFLGIQQQTNLSFVYNADQMQKLGTVTRDEEAFRRGELVEPKQPVIYYVDDKFPEAWKAYIKAGIEIWQKAFEKIGFKNAIIARDFPKDDPEFDPENFKYTCVRYCPTAVANAMGMPVVDPRTGEIIHATVYIYHNIVDMLQSRRLIQTAAADPEVRGVHLTEEILGEGLRCVVAHEVGHTLALMHNMSASAAIPVDSLRSPSFTQKHGTTYSIMDYARNNYVAQPGDKERGVKLTPPDLGLYDYYAIKWLYTPLLDAKTPQKEVAVLDRWITEKSGDPVYRCGKQQIGLRIDPSSVEEDLGDDAVKAAAYGVKNLKYIMKHLDAWTNGEDKDYAFRQRIYNEIVYQYFRYLNHVALNIGGIYLNQRYDGDALLAYEPVAREKQRQSVQFLLDQLDDLSWINSMSLQRGYPIVGNISGQLEDALFNALMKALGNVVISEEKAGKDAYTRKLYMDDLYRHFMRPTMQGKTLSDVEKKLQMKFIDQLYRSAAMNRKGMKGTDISASTKAFACRVEIPDFVKANSRADYGDIPENMAGMFSNREIVSESYAGQGFVRKNYAMRWRLELSDTAAYRAGTLVAPRKPIVFYMDTLIPADWQKAVKDGMEAWNEAFEAIGCKDVIQ